MAVSDTAALDLVGALYESALDPSRWQGTLEALSDFVDAQFAHIFFIRPEEGPVPVFAAVSSRAPDTALSGYHGHYENIDPRRIAGEKLDVGIMVPDWSLVAQDEFVRSEFYNDFYGPLGLRWLACGTLVRDSALVACLALTRGTEDEPFTEQECERMSPIVPHVARAVTLHNRFADIQSRESTGLEALNYLHVGVVLFSADGRLLFRNEAAGRVLARDDGLSWDRRHGLQAIRHEETTRLHAALRAAVSITERKALRESQVVHVSRRGFRRPYAVMFAPVSREHEAMRGGLRTAAFAVISDPDQRIAPLAEMIARVHGLTPAESDVVARLAEGYSQSEIATLRGSSVHTIRWTTKQALAKTDTRSQTDLVSLVLSGAAALATERH